MSVEESKAVVAKAYEIINSGAVDRFDEVVADDCIEHEAMPGAPDRGPEAPKAAFSMFLEAFPDLQMRVDDVIAEGDRVAVRATVTATHQGEFMGAPATNKAIEVNVIDVFEIRDGKAVQHWGVTDQAAMMEQLGLAP